MDGDETYIHRLASLSKSRKALEAHGCKPWVTNLLNHSPYIGYNCNVTYSIINVGRTLILVLPWKYNGRPIGCITLLTFISPLKRWLLRLWKLFALMKVFLWSSTDDKANWTLIGHQRHWQGAKLRELFCFRSCSCSSSHSCSWQKFCADITQLW